MNTALIIRPKDAPRIHVLECDGPKETDAVVHNYFGTYRPVMSFAEFCAQPEHHKDAGKSIIAQDFDSACRVSRLIARYALPARHQLEIQARLELLWPGCTGENLATQPNQQSA